MKKGTKNILKIGKEHYKITNYLAKRIRIRMWLLGLMTVVLTFLYQLSLEQFREIPFAGMDNHFMQGLKGTFLFLFSIIVGFILISVLTIPKNIEKHIKKKMDRQ